MRAYELTHYGPDGLRLTDVPEPHPTADQVTIEVEHIGVNALDWKIRNGFLADMLPLPLPVVIGSEIAGTVREVGDAVQGLAVGDRVAGFADSGAYAALAATRPERLTRVPAGLDLSLAAALATSAEASRRSIGLLSAAPGSTLVVNGAAGAVGTILVQLLVAAGHTVVGTASTANHDLVRSLGATPITYGDRMLDELRAAAPDGVDGAIDAAGRDFVARVADVIAPTRVVTLVDFEAGARGAIVAGGDPTQTTADGVDEVFRLAADGVITVPVARTFGFDELADALALSEGGHVSGKILVDGTQG